MFRVLLILLFLFSCSNSNEVDTNLIPEDKSKIFINKDINPQEFSEQAKAHTINWMKLNELSKLIDELKLGDFSSFKEKDDYLNNFFADLLKSIPKELKQKNITSRLLVIENSILNFKSKLSSSNSSINLNQHKIKIINAYYNFIYIINKSVEKESQLID
jgi:hypothetical protein